MSSSDNGQSLKLIGVDNGNKKFNQILDEFHLELKKLRRRRGKFLHALYGYKVKSFRQAI